MGWLDKYQQGGKLSLTGYKDNSPDKYKSWLTIPGNDITMKGVSKNIMAVPDVGKPTVMEPGNNYKFKGASQVREFPVSNSWDNTNGNQWNIPIGKSQVNIGYDPRHYQEGEWPYSAGITIPIKQTGGRALIYTSNPKDPRLQAYNDSLHKYEGVQYDIKQFRSIPGMKIGHLNNIPARGKYPSINQPVITLDYPKSSNDAFYNYAKKANNDSYELNDLSGQEYIHDFPKPQQPVVYQPNNPNDPFNNGSGSHVGKGLPQLPANYNWKPEQKLPIGQPNQLPTDIPQQQMQQMSMPEPTGPRPLHITDKGVEYMEPTKEVDSRNGMKTGGWLQKYQIGGSVKQWDLPTGSMTNNMYESGRTDGLFQNVNSGWDGFGNSDNLMKANTNGFSGGSSISNYIPDNTQMQSKTQQGNYHTDDNSDYSVDSVRQAKIGGWLKQFKY